MGIKLEQFNNKQIKAIELMALGNLTLDSIAKSCDVSAQTIYTWRRQSSFVEAVVLRSRELIRADLPEVYQSLMNTAKSGSTAAIKLVLEHLERLEELKTDAAESSITFTWDTE